MTSISIAQAQPVRPSAPLRTDRVAAGYSRLWPALLLFYAILLPNEVRITVAEQTLYAPRLAAILLLPWVLQKLLSGSLTFKLADGLMLAGVTWMIMSFVLYYDIGTGFLRAAPLAFDVIAPYLIARLTIRSLDDLRRFLVCAAPGVMVAGVSMAMESVLKTPLVRPTAASIFGRLSVYKDGIAVGAGEFGREFRLGLMRATGPFSHPILGGIFLAFFVPLYSCASIRGWPRVVGLAGAACAFFSLSSGSYLVVILSTLILVADVIQKKTTYFGWRSILWAAAFAGIFIQFASKKGLISILIRYTLDPATGYFRLLIWEYGTKSVAANPLIGIGLTEYSRASWMIASVDNHWLLLAIRHGILVPVLFGGAILLGFFATGRKVKFANMLDRKLYVAVLAATSAFVIAGFTVAYFGQTNNFFNFCIGILVSLGQTQRGLADARNGGDIETSVNRSGPAQR